MEGGWWGVTKWLTETMSILNTKPNGIIHWCHFSLHLSHKSAKSKAKLISQPGNVVDYTQLSACQGGKNWLKTAQGLVDVWQVPLTSHCKTATWATFSTNQGWIHIWRLYRWNQLVKIVQVTLVRRSLIWDSMSSEYTVNAIINIIVYTMLTIC